MKSSNQTRMLVSEWLSLQLWRCRFRVFILFLFVYSKKLSLRRNTMNDFLFKRFEYASSTFELVTVYIYTRWCLVLLSWNLLTFLESNLQLFWSLRFFQCFFSLPFICTEIVNISVSCFVTVDCILSIQTV